jgi:hypothetical protein
LRFLSGIQPPKRSKRRMKAYAAQKARGFVQTYNLGFSVTKLRHSCNLRQGYGATRLRDLLFKLFGFPRNASWQTPLAAVSILF